MIKKDAIEEVRAANPAPEVIGEYLDIKPVGSCYQGLCSFHRETNPSFTVYDDHYHCFGCEAHGDVFDFVMKQEQIGFLKAVEKLAKRANIPVRFSGEEQQVANERRELIDTYTRFVDKCHKDLFADTEMAAQVRDYLIKGRGLTEAIIKEQKVGFCTDEETQFKNRIIFPTLYHGKTIYFTGRIFGDGEPRYLNCTGKRPSFNSPDVLKAKTDEIFVVEGEIDRLTLLMNGYNTISTGGTNFKESWLPKLKKFKKIYICFDNDEAGIKGAEKLAMKIGLRAKIVEVPRE